jgi:hypothetical protein
MADFADYMDIIDFGVSHWIKNEGLKGNCINVLHAKKWKPNGEKEA